MAWWHCWRVLSTIVALSERVVFMNNWTKLATVLSTFWVLLCILALPGSATDYTKYEDIMRTTMLSCENANSISNLEINISDNETLVTYDDDINSAHDIEANFISITTIYWTMIRFAPTAGDLKLIICDENSTDALMFRCSKELAMSIEFLEDDNHDTFGKAIRNSALPVTVN
jgi:hypothetical protein